MSEKDIKNLIDLAKSQLKKNAPKKRHSPRWFLPV